MVLDPETLTLSRIIWEYHQLHHTLQPADAILVLGSHDPRVAERGAELFLAGYAPWLLFSGGFGRLTEGTWTETEAEKFARIAQEMGVPTSQILLENQSTNTGENIAFSYRLLQEKHIPVRRLILVQKPYMERRTYATFLKQWPGEEIEIMVTSPQISFEDYPLDEAYRELVIHIMLGDLQRIQLYPEKGFQVYQEIPAKVWEAFEQLKRRGFTSHLLPST
ncbi:YdcF family protein [Rufibacter psychrotolerans]|uniref:YdcF family protein n=1 Tax=Rufibacter psychrotolerans TaxID=2812556 RepID=UPI00196897EE|nr:YdcF family protein [Rufibacter sp. SYSU D00308]